jgi:hypothetical protein
MRKHFLTSLSVAFLVIAPACTAMGEAGEKGEKEENEAAEVKVTLDQVPAAAQATLKEEAKGAAITEVDKESEDGQTIYEVDVPIKGKNYEIKVAEDGTLISKKLDEDKEGDEKGDKEEKEEKGEKKA